MNVLSHLEPGNVFRFFEEICAIPHGSRAVQAVSDYCAAFARERGLEYHQDASGNIIIIKPAAPGYEDAAPVILQGHLDMVCEKEPDCAKDMAKEGLDLEVSGDYISARCTTLGGDDGIAVAMALAALDARDLPHPRLEAVFTADEEIGMLGAAALDVSPLKGRKLLNIDSEEEGVFTVSCAGGNVTECLLPLSRASFDGAVLTLKVSGLQGGHSGVEIHKGRANANMLMGRVLRRVAKAAPMRIVSVDGGKKDNAIPALCQAVIVTRDTDAARSAVREMAAIFAGEYRVTDPGVSVTAEAGQAQQLPMSRESGDHVMAMLTCLPDGVQVMSADIPGLVQTSLNLGVLATGAEELKASFCVRSSVESQKEMLVDRLAAMMEALGGKIETSGDYSGWEYLADSPLREGMVEVYRDQYGKEPDIRAIHAGVECGILSGKLPGLDCVSFGPDLLEIHTPRERMSISSVQRVWNFLLEVLRRSK